LGQEFVIKSQDLEDKINQLLPSQGGFQAGVDLSASTTIIPIVDLTESAEGSNLRQDLQTAVFHTGANVFDVTNTTTALINTTGFWRIVGTSSLGTNVTSVMSNSITITSSAVVKSVWQHKFIVSGDGQFTTVPFDLIVLLKPDPSGGSDVLSFTATSTGHITGSVRQIADVNGNLVKP
tara:strand:+ start:206 stop:742 length:537 start_codon:yes stop_codon:yes gene_type:complete